VKRNIGVKSKSIQNGDAPPEGGHASEKVRGQKEALSLKNRGSSRNPVFLEDPQINAAVFFKEKPTL